MATRPRIKIPEKITAGDVIEVKTLVNHVMETGNRRDKDGTPVQRNIINQFTAAFEGQPVFKADLQPGISANPYLAFYLRVPASGELELTWTDDSGVKTVERVRLNVT